MVKIFSPVSLRITFIMDNSGVHNMDLMAMFRKHCAFNEVKHESTVFHLGQRMVTMIKP